MTLTSGNTGTVLITDPTGGLGGRCGWPAALTCAPRP